MQNNLKYIFSVLLGVMALSSLPSFASQAEEPMSREQQSQFDYLFYQAQTARTTGNFLAAIDLFQQCEKLDSTNASVNYNLGMIHKTLNQDKTRALEYYRKAVAADTPNIDYLSALAVTSLEATTAKEESERDFSEAINAYERLVKNDPDQLDFYLYLSECYRLSKNYPKAIEQLNTVERIVGLNETISMQKYSLYSLMNQNKKAYAEVEQYIKKYPEEIKYYILLGNIYMADKKTKEALAMYDKAKTIDANNPDLIMAMTNYYEQIGNTDLANKSLHDALFNDKIDIDIKTQILADYLNRTNNKSKDELAKTVSLMDTLIMQHPQESQFNYIYGEVLLLLDRKDDARFQFQVFAESNPTNPAGWEQLLRTSFPDSLSIAKEVCEKAISYIPDGGVFYLYLSSVYHIQKDYKKALDVLIDMDKKTGNSNPYLQSEAYGRMGDLYYQMEQKDSAFVYYDKSLAINPNNLLVLNNYSYYLSVLRKDLDKAEKMSSITVKQEPTNPTYLDTYGWILFEQGAYQIAKIYLEKAVKYAEEDKDRPELEEGGNSVLYEHYGDVLSQLGETDQAVEYWIKAREGSESKTLEEKIEKKIYIAE